MKTIKKAMEDKYGYYIPKESKPIDNSRTEIKVRIYVAKEYPIMTDKDKKCIEFYNIINDKKNLKKRILPYFIEAFEENPIAALKMALYLRDIKEGMGARKSFRVILTWVTNITLQDSFKEYIRHFIYLIPKIGRWDDIFYVGPMYELDVLGLIKKGLNDSSTSSLCAKWMPRKGLLAVGIRKYLEQTPHQYRREIVYKSANTIETKICACKWDKIEFDKLSANNLYKYRNTFRKHCSETFNEFIKTRPLNEEKEIKIPSIEYIISNKRYRI
jgi:hypothetical protein